MQSFRALALFGVMFTIARPAPADQDRPLIESRGIWLDKAEMLEGREALLARLDRLQDAGFNTVYPAVQIRGAVMYSGSDVLLQYADAARRDPEVLGWLIPAARARGFRIEAWTEFGFYAHWKPADSADPSRGAILDRHPHLAAISRDGKDHLTNEWGDFHSLCPSNPESQDVLIGLYVEVLKRFDFDGISLDRIRYPEASYCYCAYCKQQFRKETGRDIPAGDSEKSHGAWLEWRKDQLTRFMERLSRRLREVRPGLRITSAVVPPAMIDGKGQDWPAWLEQGWLDAAMPMLYDADVGPSLEWMREHKVPFDRLFVGLDAGKGIAALGKNVERVRAARAGGLTIWYSGSVDPLLSDLKRDVFKGAAVSPLQKGKE